MSGTKVIGKETQSVGTGFTVLSINVPFQRSSCLAVTTWHRTHGTNSGLN